MDVGWNVVQEEGQGLVAGWVGDQVVVVQDQEQRQFHPAQLVEQSRQDHPVQVRARAAQGGERTCAHARLDRAQRLDHMKPKACGIVIALVQRDPGHLAPAGCRPPLGEQGGLAEAGRSIHEAQLGSQADLQQRLEAGTRQHPGPWRRRRQLGPHQLQTWRADRVWRLILDQGSASGDLHHHSALRSTSIGVALGR
ncbi:MAG: hypothetical protein M3O65_03330 [Actinomycetota bacterium]|nr:hypothetical protein [Actinomycetota bacterium]